MPYFEKVYLKLMVTKPIQEKFELNYILTTEIKFLSKTRSIITQRAYHKLTYFLQQKIIGKLYK